MLRGGGSAARRDNDPSRETGGEAYELGDYKVFEAAKVAHEREIRYQEKRAAKRQWLETQDEMKFSHSIQFNAVPDWSSHYIAYSNLKKL